MNSSDPESILARIAERLPKHLGQVWGGLWGGELKGPGELARVVGEYLSEVEKLAETEEFLDVETARSCAEGCLELIEVYGGHREAEVRRAVQGAVAYFAEAQDGEDDVASITGFDDDALVVRTVRSVLDAMDLTEE